jgi:hypothetical protein
MSPLATIAFLVTFTGAGYLIAVGMSRLIAEQVANRLNRDKNEFANSAFDRMRDFGLWCLAVVKLQGIR